jgi:hypothetical protein
MVGMGGGSAGGICARLAPEGGWTPRSGRPVGLYNEAPEASIAG